MAEGGLEDDGGIFYDDKVNICAGGRKQWHTREDGTSMRRTRRGSYSDGKKDAAEGSRS